LADYFSSVFAREPQEYTPHEPITCNNTVETCTINPSIQKKTFKLLEPDGLHPRVINELPNTLAFHYQSYLINLSQQVYYQQTGNKQANIFAIHQKGSKTLPQNYRPVR